MPHQYSSNCIDVKPPTPPPPCPLFPPFPGKHLDIRGNNGEGGGWGGGGKDRKLKQYKIHPAAELFPKMSSAEFEALKKDIKINGQLDPIWLYRVKGFSDPFILDGRHRYKACLELGVKPRVRLFAGNDPLSFAISQNLNRRHLTQSQKAMIGVSVSNAMREQALLERQSTIPMPSGGRGRSDTKAGAIANVSSQYIKIARRVEAHDLHLANRVRRGEINLLEASRIMKRERAGYTLSEKEKSETIDEVGLFSIIIINPPWMYVVPKPRRRIPLKVRDETIPDTHLKYLPVSALATDSAVLFLWTTSIKFNISLKLLKKWGFKYKTMLVWMCESVNTDGKDIFTERQGFELLLIATRGKPPTPYVRAPSIIPGTTNVKHRYERPKEVYDIIEQMYPEFKKLSIFDEELKDGWSTLGDIEQIRNIITREMYKGEGWTHARSKKHEG